jgi:5-methylthioadenosine/S-adenosylhomocysteine deaminase
MAESLLIRGATVVALDSANRVFDGDVLIQDGMITEIAPRITPPTSIEMGVEIIDGRGRVLLPGFVQTHIHLCQTLFRGAADDLALIDWLKQRVWPMEAAHTYESLSTSARLGIAELISGGTTCALTMETVHHTEAVLRAVDESGFRAIVGKCMMDQGEGVPDGLHERTEDSIAESLRLIDSWHGRDEGRIRCAFAPRFAISCTRELLEKVACLANERRLLVHTHASENRDEIAAVEHLTGRRNIEYLRDVGLSGPHVVLAHCIWIDDRELEILYQSGTRVAHCPSSNLKLGSGFARIKEMLERGIDVSLGADGAPCNNRLDMFTEMRTAALLQKALHGPQCMPALTTLRMATIDGAKALGLDGEIGSIEAGKRADLTLLNLEKLHAAPQPDLISTIVYAGCASDVETVIIGGRIVLRDRRLLTLNEAQVIARAREQSARIRSSLAATLTH